MIIRWSPLARRDRNGQIIFVAADSPSAAFRMDRAIDRATVRLAKYPELGRLGRRSGTRELQVGRTPYRLIYRVEPARITILRLLHGAMRPQ